MKLTQDTPTHAPQTESQTKLQTEIGIPPQTDAKIDRMGTESTFKLLLEFSVPAVIGVLVQMLYNVIDAVYVGHAVGPDGLAATTVANPLMTAIIALAMLVGVGGNAVCAIKLGEGKKQVAQRVLGNAFTLLLLVSAAIWVIAAVAMDPILRYSGADDIVMPYAKTFVTIIVIGCPLQFISFGMNNFIRTAGHPNRALGSMLIGTGANIVLGYLFIIVFGWGMLGAGFATLLSWGISAAFVMQFFLSKNSPMPLRLKSLAIKPKIALRIFALGLAPSIMEMGFAVSSMIENNLLTFYGATDPLGADGALAVMRVLASVGLLVVMPSMGLSMGSQPIIGYNYGAKNYDRMKATLRQAILMGIAITTPLWLSVILLPDMYSHLFGLPEQYIAATSWALIAYLIFIPILPVAIVGANYFDATGQAFKATVLTLTRQILFLIPLLLICPILLPQIIPVSALQSVFIAPSISDITSTLLVGGFLLAEWRRLDKQIARSRAAKALEAQAAGSLRK
ncbi:MAG: MATE family efflux transporter [Raoultibacter sp.]